jgi:flagellar FliL protein
MARNDSLLALPAPEKSGGSAVLTIVALFVLTLVAAGAGGFAGLRLFVKLSADIDNSIKGNAPSFDTKYAGNIALKDLPPIVTNLAEPADVWIRLQVSIVYDTKAVPKPDLLVARISEDTLAFMRTLSLAQLAGASGLQHLREDLSERAIVRSDGNVRELVIQALVVQ